jgi:signal transduction histidine kinase
LTTTAQLLKKHNAIVHDAEGLNLLLSLQTSAKSLQRLIENFILYAQIELMASDPVLLQAFREGQTRSDTQLNIKSAVRLKAKQAYREADLYLDVDNVVVNVSKADLTKITEELMDNALRFSTAGTPIQVIGKHTKGTFNLSITNQGQGMSAEQIANIGASMRFGDRLYEQAGTGLGLTIAKRIAELYGGQLTVEGAPRLETTLQVTLPIYE